MGTKAKKRVRMNKARMRALHKHLRYCRSESFDYESSLWSEGVYGLRGINEGMALRIEASKWCGTTGCVAGHAAILFRIADTTHGFSQIASHLGLNDRQGYFLFFQQIENANRRAALRRLRYLIDGGDVEQYDFKKEAQVCGYEFVEDF